MNVARPYDPRSRQSFYSTVRPGSQKVSSCTEVECEMQEQGWVTKVVRGSQMEYDVRALIVSRGMAYVEHLEGDSVVFLFDAGQECFRIHRVATRPPDLKHLDGRGGAQPATRGEIRAAKVWRPDNWLEKFHEETDKVEEVKRREGISEMRAEGQLR